LLREENQHTNLKPRRLHPSVLILISILIIAVVEIILQLVGIERKIKITVPALPIVPLHERDPRLRTTPADVFFTWDRYLLWRCKPRATGRIFIHSAGRSEEIELNSLGFRSHEINKLKRAGQQRIICMGDSTTFGWSIYREDAFPEVLGKLLNQDKLNGRFEVINAGVPGYSSFQGLILLKRVILELKPDFVTICFGSNDNMQNQELTEDKKVYEFNNSLQGRLRELLAHSKIYILLENVIVSLQEKISTGKERAAGTGKVRVPVEDFEENIREMIRILRGNEIRPVIINHYKIRGDARDYEVTPYNRVMERLSRETNVISINTRRIFSAAAERLQKDPTYREQMRTRFPETFLWDENSLRRFYMDYCHPTRYGHYLIALSLADKVFEEIMRKSPSVVSTGQLTQ